MARIMQSIEMRAGVLTILFILCSCNIDTKDAGRAQKGVALNDIQFSALTQRTIFFGHQSVGADIVKGFREVLTDDQRSRFRIVNSDEPEALSSPAFVESLIGVNGKPESKNDAFAAILGKGFGANGGIAMFKYCYVDINSSTDVKQLFAAYRDDIVALKQKYPLLKIVHITVPLTTVESSIKAWIKTALGKVTARAVNEKRNQFNWLLAEAFAKTDPVFDLAGIESTRPDGTRSYFVNGNKRVFSLAPEYTSDGGHLNELGRRVVAERFLLFLSGL